MEKIVRRPTEPVITNAAVNGTSITLTGTAEANAIIKVYAVATAGPFAGQDILIGQTTAVPIDGTNADPSGRWSVTSHSAKIVEVEDGKPLMDGYGQGFLWRLNSYWLLEPRGQGVYICLLYTSPSPRDS